MEVSGCSLRYYPGISLEGLRKPRKSSLSITGLQAEILAQNLSNMKQEC
jgi:hypothetical protein